MAMIMEIKRGGPELLLWKVLHGAGGAGRWVEPGAGEAFQV